MLSLTLLHSPPRRKSIKSKLKQCYSLIALVLSLGLQTNQKFFQKKKKTSMLFSVTLNFNRPKNNLHSRLLPEEKLNPYFGKDIYQHLTEHEFDFLKIS